MGFLARNGHWKADRLIMKTLNPPRPHSRQTNSNVPRSTARTSTLPGREFGGAGCPSSARRQDADTTKGHAGWIARMFCNRVTVVVFGMLLVYFTSGCMVAGEKEVNPVTQVSRTAFLVAAGTDAGSLPMPYRNADGTLAEAKDVNQSRATATVTTGVVFGMAVKAYEAGQTGAQGVDRALSKDGTRAAMNADNNATRAAINTDNNALKKAELSLGQ